MVNPKSKVKQRRYRQLLLFREDIESIVNLFVLYCQDVEILIDKLPVSLDNGRLPLEERHIRSFIVKGYEDTIVASRTNEKRQSVQLKMTSLSAAISMSDALSLSLREVALQTDRLLSSRTRNMFTSLLLRLACFVVLGNEVVLTYVFQTSHTLIHVAADIVLIALWLAFGAWGLVVTNRIYLMNLDAKNMVINTKRKEVLKTVLMIIGAILIGVLVMWLKKNS